MNYNKIQETLQGDSKFAPLVANRDVKVPTRGGEVAFAALTVRVAQEMSARGIEDKGWQKTLILAFAAKLSSGITTAPSGVEPKRSAVALKKGVEEKAERVTVRPTQNPSSPVSPAKQAIQQQNQQLAKFIDKGEILKYQSAIAVCQLLASIFQLAEHDTWPGNEKRKALLNELLESYEELSKSHVNLSVKQIIRAQIESQITG